MSSQFGQGNNDEMNCWYYAALSIGTLLLFGPFEGRARADEFIPDANTLLLAHFNKDARTADYAVGVQEFGGSGAQVITDGYYGKALDLSSAHYTPDFLTADDDFTPEFRGWGFYERGNIDYRQGTLEFWFQTRPSDRSKASFGGVAIDCGLARNVRNPGDAYYSSGSYTLTNPAFNYRIPLLNGRYQAGRINFSQILSFKKGLTNGQWHHFAMCWSPGEWIVYLDGRPLVNYDMTGKLGHALSSNPCRFISMRGGSVDELRISNNVRYPSQFEPQWREGKRPTHAFPGNSGLHRFAMNMEPVYTPMTIKAARDVKTHAQVVGDYQLQFDEATGALAGLTVGGKTAGRNVNGLMLWEGLAHAYLKPQSAGNWQAGKDQLAFTQNVAGKVKVSHQLTGRGKTIQWRVTLKNTTDKEIWLNVLMGLPLPMDHVSEYFDGTSVKRELSVPRYKEMYSSTIPFVAAAGDGLGLGVGIDPHICLHAIPCEWIPEGTSGTIRQGAKLALAPGEQYTYTFHVVATNPAPFGAMDALDTFQGLFPDLYRLRPDVPVYSYMPTQEYIEYYPYPEHSRLGYAGAFWGHGPGHCPGDEYGNPEFWANPKFKDDPSYLHHCLNYEKMWGSLESLHRFISAFHRWSFDNYYPVRRTHICPDLCPEFFVRAIQPDFQPVDDPLCFGQYYYDPSNKRQLYIVNECNTPIGKQFIKDSILQYHDARKPYSPGWINDMSHSPLMRMDDSYAKRTPGRAFSVDKGTYVLRTAGRQQRYEVVNGLIDQGHRQTIWSDGGQYSYTLCAFSSAVAIEGSDWYTDLAGLEGTFSVGRMLLGEKPMTALNTFGVDALGTHHAPGDFTPKTLRDYYRYLDAHLGMFCIHNGITLSPPYLLGRQQSMELQPIAVESTASGRQLVAAARVDDPLWVVRSGKILDTLLVVGNDKPQSHTTDVAVVNTYFGGSPLFGAYLGGRLTHSLGNDCTAIQKVAVPARDVAAFKILGTLSPAGSGIVRTTFSGDGITLAAEVATELKQAGTLKLNTFSPMYKVERLIVDGQSVHYEPAQGLALTSGKHVVQAQYINRTFAFTKAAWDGVDLIKDGQTRFRIIADQGRMAEVGNPAVPLGHRKFPIGFEHGTAMMLNEFLEYYDEEDGVGGNLKPAEITQKTSDGYAGWTVRLNGKANVEAGRVRIEPATKTIVVEGRSEGDCRRAMVVWLRLIDRKYPHIGRVVPMMDLRKKWYLADGRKPWDVWFNKASQPFFAAFADPQWLVKPILRAEYESLYANGNMNFAGRYRMKVCPYIFEPTYAESFVYGPLIKP